MALNLRWLRHNLRHVIPEPIKRHFRARLFGYTRAEPPSDWQVTSQGEAVRLSLGKLTAEFPGSVGDSLRYHCLENGDSIDELRGFLSHARACGGTLFDVGAADGLFATVFALAGPENRAVAFEPSASLRPHIESVIAMNRLADRVSLVGAAVGRSVGEARGSINPAGMLIVDAEQSGGATVPMTTLDAFAADHEPPTAIKIDVEGYEGEVIRGASHVLASARPVLFLEFHLDMLEEKGESVEEILTLLTGAGYHFESSRGERISSSAVSDSPNAIIRFIARADA